ncbi:MAG: fluoride efflux transporter CrcB [Gammaproteobacteria bacterium]|nr:fluoride efflux transporter CrcB [Gammaproteobacteria bacterium]NIR99091.1 fluoride efflux transporter CrcB [Gammaproteobacteria bacterium]NIT64723.1 fluoride efflux transporter CrcB [Gammaproteobacteria bacterium]NIV21681.1 fluoride efflux transporter CrcB [Gammaproteobacteria bacterium]NIX10552.1 fluoride efflux transporter CrcB [Gammaproteobacteria bacterium]
MTALLAIAAGGAAGALFRYGVSTAVATLLGRGFPYGTLVVNVAGCLLTGILYVVMLERMVAGPEWRAGLLIGVLGAFTTFSTFSMETLLLVEEGENVRALLNVAGSVLFCLGATWLGMIMGRQL